ncbi:MAG: translation elongation factor Ts [Bdellovibrionales bacterium RIFCSPHIGHO2_01_FULL_40_29]|nr:MAG: translation elongation factor Ts [Bdellovibrionales bacterium RIFCSPHIGHO2_01_FULL_40_29]OFZ33122.1 MAG: translation elongation factor Ts [Bdellovibrionales bacterium RIFCSPHIGHO2_02_FULL_40_15]
MSISASMVKELREKTSAGMMDCKKALEESKGDFEAAVEWLRVKGLSAAAKKSDRIAAEGLVNATTAGTTAAVVEINSETDFVSRNDAFKSFVNDITQHVLTATSTADILNQPYAKAAGKNVGDILKEAIAKIGENIVIRRAEKYTVTGSGLVHTYIHGEGKIGVMIEVATSTPAAATSADAKTFAADVCLHIAAMNPMAISSEQIPADVVSKEKEILKAKNLEQGKKPEMIEKIVDGQIRKFLAENCLLDQSFVKNPDLKVSDYMKEASKKAGGDLTIKRFVRFELGAGIEKKVVDFAAEVAEQTRNH